MPDIRPFPAIPIVGQPLAVLGWTLLVTVRCQCEAPHVLQLIVKQHELGRNADLGICPGCGKAMHVQQISMNAQNQLEFGIELGAVPPHPAGVAS